MKDNFIFSDNGVISVLRICNLFGYRKVATWEKNSCIKPREAVYWTSEEFKFREVAEREWWNPELDYFVPVDLELKKKELTDEDAKRRPKVLAWNTDRGNAEFGTLLYVRKIEGKCDYIIEGLDNRVRYYGYCELIEEARNE